MNRLLVLFSLVIFFIFHFEGYYVSSSFVSNEISPVVDSKLSITSNRVNTKTDVIEITVSNFDSTFVAQDNLFSLSFSNLNVKTFGYIKCFKKTNDGVSKVVKTIISFKDNGVSLNLPCPPSVSKTEETFKILLIAFPKYKDIRDDFNVAVSLKAVEEVIEGQERFYPRDTLANTYTVFYNSGDFKGELSGPTRISEQLTFILEGVQFKSSEKNQDQYFYCKVGNNNHKAELLDSRTLRIYSKIEPNYFYPFNCPSISLVADLPNFLSEGAYYAIGDSEQFDVLFGPTRHDRGDKDNNDDNSDNSIDNNNLLWTFLTVCSVLFAFFLGVVFTLMYQKYYGKNYHTQNDINRPSESSYSSFA